MARFSIRFIAGAADELEEADEWFSAQSPKLADDWRKAVRETLKSIRETPTLWAADRDGSRRVLVRPFSYQVIYYLHGNTIEIVALSHTSRRPGYWKRRLKKR